MKHQSNKLLIIVLRQVWVSSMISLAVGRFIIRHFLDRLEIWELLQVKLVHLIVDHCSQCKKPGNVLEQDECSHDDGDGTFQRSDYRCFIEQQEKNQWGLQQQGEQPESSQLGHLATQLSLSYTSRYSRLVLMLKSNVTLITVDRPQPSYNLLNMIK